MKLSETTIQTIRQLYPSYTQQQIADMFNISRFCVRNCILNLTYYSKTYCPPIKPKINEKYLYKLRAAGHSLEEIVSLEHKKSKRTKPLSKSCIYEHITKYSKSLTEPK